MYIITGPTASGKTAVALALAKQIGGEIINADSMQIYKGMDIGTAKPTPAEQAAVPHHLIDIIYPNEPYSAALYQQQANKAIQEIQRRGNVPILTGGTGFYINTIAYNPQFAPTTPDDTPLRNHYTTLATQNPPTYLHDLLKQIDPTAATQIHPNNTKRLARALAYCKTTQTLFSTHNTTQNQKKTTPPQKITLIILDMPREILYNRINQRTNQMLKNGLIEEVKSLLNAGYPPTLPALQSIGYKETVTWLQNNGDASPAAGIAQATRNYAKRQLTWLRNKTPHARWLELSSNANPQEIATYIRKEFPQ